MKEWEREARRKEKEYFGALLWDKVRLQSDIYMRAFNVDETELEDAREKYRDDPGFTIITHGEGFTFITRRVKGTVYGGEWETVIMCRCETNRRINYRMGTGSKRMFALPEIWHERVLKELENVLT